MSRLPHVNVIRKLVVFELIFLMISYTKKDTRSLPMCLIGFFLGKQFIVLLENTAYYSLMYPDNNNNK